jgi:hypothetical protein
MHLKLGLIKNFVAIHAFKAWSDKNFVAIHAFKAWSDKKFCCHPCI